MATIGSVVPILPAANLEASIGYYVAQLGFELQWRADGMASVLRGFTAAELSGLVRDATGVEPLVRGAPFWRLSASWRKRARPLPETNGPRLMSPQYGA